MNWFRTVVASMVLALGFTAVAGHAAPPVAQPAKNSPISIAQVGEMLKSLGYGVEAEKDRSGNTIGYWTKVKLGDGSVDVFVELSGTGSTVWFTIPLTTVKDLTTLTPEMLTGMLKASAKTNGLITFVMTPDNQLILQMWQHAENASASSLNFALLALIQQALDTGDLWMQAK